MTQYPVDEPTAGFDDTPSEWPPRRSATDDTAGVAKEQASQVKDTAVSAGQDVAATAKSEAGNVVAEAKDQAAGLLDQAKSEAGSQVSGQQQRAAGLLSGYADELKAMTSGQESSGPVTDLARQGADKAREYASWLEQREPADVLDEIRAFARRRPVAFLVGAALAGVVVGRATRGFAANAKQTSSSPASSPATPVRDEQPVRSVLDEVPTASDPYGYDETLHDESAEPVLSPALDEPRRADVIR